MNFNKVILVGNLTRDPEIKYLQSGTPVGNINIAINHRYKSGEETKEEVCFMPVSLFGKQAENCSKYLSKGSSVLVEGRLRQRRWETESGDKRSITEVIANTVQFLSKKKAEETEPEETDVPF